MSSVIADICPVLVTGGSGQLGNALRQSVWPRGWRMIAPDRQALDLRDSEAIVRTIRAGHDGLRFAAVIHCAAYTDVDRAETNPAAAWTLNATVPAALAGVCAACTIPIVHVSTDYVFAGDRQGVWQVDDSIAPLNVYGASKAGGELAIRGSGARYAIVRTSWLFSAQRPNFVTTMLDAARHRERLSVVADQHGSPTGAGDLAAALLRIAQVLVADDAMPGGTVHFTNAGHASRAEFAAEIFRQSRAHGGPDALVLPVPSSAYPLPARRPANTILSLDAIRRRYGIVPRDWRLALRDTIAVLMERS